MASKSDDFVPLSERILIRMPEELKERLQKLCKKEYKSISDKVRELIAKAVKADK